MPITIEQLEGLFPDDQSGNRRQFEYDEQIDRFTGHVVNREFRGLSVPDRQDRVWRQIRTSFGEESQKISLVLTFTPEEWQEIHDEAA